MKRRGLPYSEEFKRKVVKEYLETNISQTELRQKYNIGGKGCISYWMRNLGLSSEPKNNRRYGYKSKIMKRGKPKTPSEKALEKKLKELESQLEYEKLRSDALDKMIEIAENRFNIPIRKKPGTKQ